MIITNTIKDENDWKLYYPPAGKDKQWKPGFSALEFAKAVINKGFETEINNLLGNLKFDSNKVYPEHLTYFDDVSSGPRHHDMACICTQDEKKVALCFEAKVKESLDQKLKKAIIDNSKSKKSNKPFRVRNFCKLLFKKDYDSSTMGEIYYQLLSGAMGTLTFAYENDISRCYFIIYQLVPEYDSRFFTTIKKHKRAINDFIQQINSSYDINKQNVIRLGKYKFNLDEKKGEKEIELNIAYIEHRFIH